MIAWRVEAFASGGRSLTWREVDVSEPSLRTAGNMWRALREIEIAAEQYDGVATIVISVTDYRGEPSRADWGREVWRGREPRNAIEAIRRLRRQGSPL